jgi:prolyl-tRNA synthetase
MRMSKLVGKTVKETPRDAEIPSHKFMLRGGFIRQYSAGIYGLLPLGMRCLLKIEKRCREEMDALDGQEIKMPCAVTRELWEETGRDSVFGKDMFKFFDRHDKEMVLNPTHEEPVVYLARTELSSYRQLPLMLYQIQTKFRDEPRPRGGLIRLREFLMKDAYSFHTTEEDLKKFYEKMHQAYLRFYKRIGCKNFVSVLSDNGLFGGRYSHEFQMLVPTGEDKLFSCSHCQYSANSEISSSPFVTTTHTPQPLEKVYTPQQKTIQNLCHFLKISPEKTIKAVIFQTQNTQMPVVCFVRGDLDVIEQKVRALIQLEVVAATSFAIEQAGAIAGSAGPLGLSLHCCYVIVDNTVLKSNNLVTGANETDYHYIHFDIQRDFLATLTEAERSKVFIGDIAAVRAGDPCSQCSCGVLQETRGIEIGNIFHLGTKYSENMNCTYLDSQGKKQHPFMGCYGIGLTRLLPAVIEQSHDDRGPVFPLPIAPFEIHLCILHKKDPNIFQKAEELYMQCVKQGLEILMDDRDEKPGSQFADADLIGVPYRLVLSPTTFAENCVELSYRDKRQEARKIKFEDLLTVLKNELCAEYEKYKSL